MVVAHAYILHVKISQYISFFSFGMAEYCFQAVLLIMLIICFRKFKFTYLLFFITAFLYGLLLDLAIFITGLLQIETFLERIICFTVELPLSSLSIALFFKTYIMPESYEVVVKEILNNLNIEIGKIKTIYDCISCILSIILSFSFFGLFHFESVKLGTIICVLINGFLIPKIGKPWIICSNLKMD